MVIQEAMDIEQKLRVLSDAAKYDVACTSSGVSRPGKPGTLGNTYAGGICHSFAADGRCISLLKILFTNQCIYDCKYCVNRSSNDVVRAAFTPEEVCRLTVEFYRRNYIEGLFLSSGILYSADYTMEQMVQALYRLRVEYHFNGYIHLKAIPGASPELIEQAGFLADRMSVNLELPTAEGLRTLAPGKTREKILAPMRQVQQGIAYQNLRGLEAYGGSALGGREGRKLAGKDISALWSVSDSGGRIASVPGSSERTTSVPGSGENAAFTLGPGARSVPDAARGSGTHSVPDTDLGFDAYSVSASDPSLRPTSALNSGSDRHHASGSSLDGRTVPSLRSQSEIGMADSLSHAGRNVWRPLQEVGDRFFVPAGQSTQMIVGATPESDFQMIQVAQALYRNYDLKRVFYSAFVRVNDDSHLPVLPGGPPLLREHRLYQADWLLRFYGFQAEELLSEDRPNFNVLLDPKCDWALRHLELFPVEVNRADYATLLRVPGLGVKSARRIVASRRSGPLDFPDLKKLGVVLKRAMYFITCSGRSMIPLTLNENAITSQLIGDERRKVWELEHHDSYRQLSLFDDYHVTVPVDQETVISAVSGAL